MILDKQIRSALVNKLKLSTLVTTLVDSSNILNFPIKKIDMANTPSIGVFTLKTTDNSGSNAIKNDNTIDVYFEITGTNADTVDDIENLIDTTIVDDTAYWQNYESLDTLEQPVYQGNFTQMEDDGARIRIVKTVTYTLRYSNFKGVETVSETLEGFDGKILIEEDGIDSQLNNEVEVNL